MEGGRERESERERAIERAIGAEVRVRVLCEPPECGG